MPEEEHRRVVAAFAKAAVGQDLQALVRLLDHSVVLRSDGGGVVRAARRPILGADKVSRFLLGVGARQDWALRLVPTTVNGRPGLSVIVGGRVGGVVDLVVDDGLITEISVVLNPAKLRSTTLWSTNRE